MLASKQTILPSLETATNVASLAQQYPWYPTAQLWLSEQGNTEAPGKLAAFVQQPLRMHVLLTAVAPAQVEPESLGTNEQPEAVALAAEAEETVYHDPVHPPEEAAEEPAADAAAQEEQPLAAVAATASSDDEDLLFQPYHTVDYFAALGIKMDASQLGTTRFDVQLKSFTQWLKTMKRINYQTGQISNDPLVEAQASASLQTKEVVTEAMAEVLAQQGMAKQAIAVYEKLSLLHPEKSVFFAARIEKLKAEK
ncbi:hypothetical protein [Phnomibacter ginsenosidimutans]|uniref:Uncharacterized protein n=1 Tax=Phnomibacter ginsenosidimutans TaxID=2676868 RepID=A0A6I6G8I0_9BACT|nr:hypothetical protein [Phnomibacter ginsenosidimutans]QGW27763.1 hypothetical protein GLV81_06365 [Phnomibacter ginsenosidimutans]